MKLASHRRESWIELGSEGDLMVRPHLIRRGLVEVVRLGVGEPLVMLPGLAGGWQLMMPLARRLARDYQVTLVGLRGDRGAPDSCRQEDPAVHAAELDSLIDTLGIENPLVLGLSFGGAVALELALRRRSRLRGIILSGTTSQFSRSLGSHVALRVLERYPLPKDNAFVNQFFNLLHGKRPEADTLSRFIVERCWETDQGVMARRLRSLDQFDVTNRLDRIDLPALVLAGTRDIVTPHTRQRALAEALPQASFSSIEDAGHVGFLTHRTEVARQIRRWARRRVHLAAS